ncbi:DUF397 domain-containing protein [Streptomyces sp. CFMR 7]
MNRASVRDSKDQHGPALVLPRKSGRAFGASLHDAS